MNGRATAGFSFLEPPWERVVCVIERSFHQTPGKMQVTIDLPDDVGLDEHEAKERVVALLYEAGTLSEKQGCEVLGLSRRAFQEMLSEHDVAYMNSDPEDIQYELRHRRE